MCFAEEQIDELTPIALYMVQEMNANVASDVTTKMQELNKYSIKSCISEFQSLPLWQQLLGLGVTPDQCVDREISYRTAALLMWAEKVRQNAAWDHKPIIRRRFNSRNLSGEQHWHLYGNTLYYYDVWSNIHYGYVGIAAGFSEAILLDGAGLEQIGSALFKGSLPTSDSSVHGLRSWDDKQDRIGIQIGIKLYQLHPTELAVQNLLNEILKSHDIRTKEYNS